MKQKGSIDCVQVLRGESRPVQSWPKRDFKSEDFVASRILALIRPPPLGSGFEYRISSRIASRRGSPYRFPQSSSTMSFRMRSKAAMSSSKLERITARPLFFILFGRCFLTSFVNRFSALCRARSSENQTFPTRKYSILFTCGIDGSQGGRDSHKRGIFAKEPSHQNDQGSFLFSTKTTRADPTALHSAILTAPSPLTPTT